MDKSLSKYHSLVKIELLRLPHPDWVFAEYNDLLPREPWCNAPFGWSLRSCPKNVYEFGLKSKHHLIYSEINDFMRFFHYVGNISSFVVYPSWEFLYSGCLFYTTFTTVIEVVEKEISGLLEGLKSPDAIYKGYGPIYTDFDCTYGNRNLLSDSVKRILIKATNKLNEEESFLILEWSFTSDSIFFFHDLFQEYSK